LAALDGPHHDDLRRRHPDDWNISWRWIEEMRAKPWWEARITVPS
jgi:hypothetical protein